VILLAEAPKSRLACWMTVARGRGMVERREVPDEALDRHTRRGRRMGRGWDHFWDEASQLADQQPHPLRLRRAMEKAPEYGMEILLPPGT
jgi:hypothetical protein